MATKKKARADRTPVRIEKLSDDPICLRASIGGRAGDGFYCRYRGDEREVIAALEAALYAMKKCLEKGALGAWEN
jgi:hypothetical protein